MVQLASAIRTAARPSLELLRIDELEEALGGEDNPRHEEIRRAEHWPRAQRGSREQVAVDQRPGDLEQGAEVVHAGLRLSPAADGGIRTS